MCLKRRIVAMNTMQLGLLGRRTLSVAMLVSTIPAFAADLSADSFRFAPGVVKAAGYETIDTKYIVAIGTSIYSDHAFHSMPVGSELRRGERVDVLAKVKGWEWVLVGKEGAGIGYVSISMLSPEDKYVP
jgi:hypothetical protein